MASALFSPVTASDLHGSPTGEAETKRYHNALAALADWQEEYLDNPARRAEFFRASAIPPEHMLKDVQLARAIADGARYLDGPCSHGIDLLTAHQDRYEYVVLGRLVEELRQASSAENVSLPKVVFGTLPTGQLNAQSVRAPRTDYYLTLFHSGLFGYIYLLGRIVASCIPYERHEGGYRYLFGVDDIDRAFANGETHTRYITPATAARWLETLLMSCVREGTPWESPPTRVKRVLIPFAESLVDGGQAFVVAHEFGHIFNGHLEQAGISHSALGAAGEADTADYGWADEMSADFFGLQASMAACAHRERPALLSTYAGADLYFLGVKLLYNTIALTAGFDEDAWAGLIRPPIEKRRTALRNGMEYYLSHGAAEIINQEAVIADAVDRIITHLWGDCRRRFQAAPETIAPLWRPVLNHLTLWRDRGNLEASRAIGLGKKAYELLAAMTQGSTSERTLAADIAPAIAVTLFFDSVSPNPTTRDRAVHWLAELDAGTGADIPLVKYVLSCIAPADRMGDYPQLVQMASHFAAQIRIRAGQEPVQAS